VIFWGHSVERNASVTSALNSLHDDVLIN